MVDGGRGMPMAVASGSSYHNQYAAVARYEDVIANRQLFMTTLEKLHATMGTKFMYVNYSPLPLPFHFNTAYILYSLLALFVVFLV